MKVELTLPWPPSVNTIWGVGKRGNWYAKKVLTDYKEIVYYLVFKSKTPKFTKEQRLRLDVFAYPPDRRSHDLDNLLKAVGDSLQAAKVFPNDNQIDQLWIERKEIKRNGEVRVIITTIGEDIENDELA